jgi:hypothetical protein
LPLHCAELLVNMVRDESTWRKASKNGRSRSNAIISMLGSLPAVVLFIFKPFIHWLYSLAITVYFSLGVNMRPPQIVYLGVGGALLAFFTMLCAFWRPKGPQPAAFGHLQTLVDLVDDWSNKDEKMYWGQKEAQNGQNALIVSIKKETMLPKDQNIYHAGTAAERLQPISFNEMYMG